jgi:diphthamide synthase (EF-2-diphthine--ammonia ligase)
VNASLDPCGENGEFHTIVTDGPIFKKKILISGSDVILRDGYWFLNINGFSFQEK